jgi:hypothetical protein
MTGGGDNATFFNDRLSLSEIKFAHTDGVIRRETCSMKLKEKNLFHQVHPIKLATDIGAAVISLYFFWKHELVVGFASRRKLSPDAPQELI